MPGSDNISIPYVSAILQSLRPSSALDVGIGMGKFGFIFREACEWSRIFEDSTACISKENWHSRLDGVEVCPAYITPLQRYLYNEIFVGPAQEIVARLGHYDLVFLGDVIEHFEKSEGQRLLDILFEKARLGILVVTPVGEYKQDGIEGNPYEKHLSVWSPADLRRFPYIWACKAAKRQWVIFIACESHWLRDPNMRRMTKAWRLRSGMCRKRLKKIFRTLFGEKGLELLIKIKRRLEGVKDE